MACLYPLDAWRSTKVNESGKRGITFQIREANIDEPLQVPCGRCVGCASDRAMVWGIRVYHESTLHKRNSFLTLTYADPPKCLNVRDLQLFIKRLRKLLPVQLRYFACGEYGSVTHRPHYHVCLFGEDFLGGSFPVNDKLYSHPQLNKAWGHGFTSVGDLTIGSALYCAGYCVKKRNDPDTFNTMSRRPGIGHTWLDRFGSDISATGSVVIEGRQYPVPKRYLEWAGIDLEHVMLKRQSIVANRTPDEIWKRRVNVRSRELNQVARLKQRVEVI